jgi:hypothetical protein
MTNIPCYRCGTVNKVELEDGEHKIKCRWCWTLIHLSVVTKPLPTDAT